MIFRRNSLKRSRAARRLSYRPGLEFLEERLNPTGATASPFLFDASVGQLLVWGSHTVQVANTATGGLAVIIDDQVYSSDAGTPAFAPALSGANSATLRSIDLFGGGAADSLTLDNLAVANLAVSTDGSVTLSGTLAVTEQLTVEAAALTINGAVQAADLNLTSAGLLDVTADGSLTARSGGTLAAAADSFVNVGQLRADGANGGSITVRARDVLNGGLLSAAGVAGTGGDVRVGFTESYIDTATAQTTANGAKSVGGWVTVDGGTTGRLFSSGRFDASGSNGGNVDLFGQDILLVSATVSATGATANGGSVRIGGDYQGSNPDVANAQTVTLTATTVVQAAGAVAGGRVIVWSETNTDCAAQVAVTGGQTGGFIEVSSHNQLTYNGQADAGKGGTLLLDPKFLVVSAGASVALPQFNLPNPGTGGTFGAKVRTLSTGNVVVTDPTANNNKGAVYLFNGQTGALLSTLTGSNSGDKVGSGGVTALTNGNYVVVSPNYNGGDGAATWGNGTTGTSGTISATNSLVGSSTNDQVGSGGVTALTNGNYVVSSPAWTSGSSPDEGAVTWGSGTAGVRGVVSATNSLVGTVPYTFVQVLVSPGDQVGGGGVLALTNGNYVVDSPDWDYEVGAVTWGNGTVGLHGTISTNNSLVGSTRYTNNPATPKTNTVGDQVGNGGVSALANGNYVVASPSWSGNLGAATWGNGTTGSVGVLNVVNSFVGVHPGDQVGGHGVTALTNGNYVVDSPNWNGNVGAVTWGKGTSGLVGVISAANSLVGSSANDLVGSGGVTALLTANYVVDSPSWKGNLGAATWANGSLVAVVSTANSLVGTHAGDKVGSAGITALSNGNYVVASPSWNGNRGATTWAIGTKGTVGMVSAANSLVGTNPGDQVGGGGVTALTNGNYVVASPTWNGNLGAATWSNGTTSMVGVVSATNSLVGTSPGDQVSSGGVTMLANGNYAVASPNWNGSLGAATFSDGSNGATADGQHTINAQNSLLGTAANTGLSNVLGGPFSGSFLAAFPTENGGRVTIGIPNPNFLTFALLSNQTVTVTPSFLTHSLNAGTNVTLQANNDITVNDFINVTPSGTPGNLTLQAGRSLLLNASINTAGGNLTLIANQAKANGVIDSQRDPGNAAITMASGVTLATGAGNLLVDLQTSTDKTNNGKGVVTLLPLITHSTTLSATTVLGVTLNGTTAGDGSPGTYTQTAVAGTLNLDGATLQVTHNTNTPNGTVFAIAHTTGGVSGTFAGLPEGSVFTAQDGTQYQISYQANGGDDVTLTQGNFLTAAITPVSPNPSHSAVSSITIVFNRAVNNFTLANLQLQRNGTNVPLLSSGATLTSTDNITWTLSNLAGILDPTHHWDHYTLTLASAGSGITDASNNPLTGVATTSFTLLDPALVLQGNTLTVEGTPGNDTFSFTAGSPESISLNGVSYNVDPAVTMITFIGNGGSDSATLTGLGGDYAALNPTYVTLSSPGYVVTAANCSSVTAFSSGNATADFGLSATGADIYRGTPTYTETLGVSYHNKVMGFAHTHGFANGNANAIAYLTTSTGADEFGGVPAYSFVQGANDSYDSYAIGFALVEGSTASSSAIAYLGTSTGHDEFGSVPTYSFVQGANYAIYVVGFHETQAYAGGANSVAYLSTSANDTYNATSAYSVIVGATGAYLNYAIGFQRVQAYGNSNTTANLQQFSFSDPYIDYTGTIESKGAGYDNFAIGFTTVRRFAAHP